MRACVEPVLAAAGRTLGEVPWFLPHQPNGHMLAELTRAFGVDPARMFPIVDTVGSIGAASIPTSLDRLWRSGKLRPGDEILMTGVGSGTAAAALLYRVAA
jgi:3-oxoacyl-[acyl-carrier-protein] synthase III